MRAIGNNIARKIARNVSRVSPTSRVPFGMDMHSYYKKRDSGSLVIEEKSHAAHASVIGGELAYFNGLPEPKLSFAEPKLWNVGESLILHMEFDNISSITYFVGFENSNGGIRYNGTNFLLLKTTANYVAVDWVKSDGMKKVEFHRKSTRYYDLFIDEVFIGELYHGDIDDSPIIASFGNLYTLTNFPYTGRMSGIELTNSFYVGLNGHAFESYTLVELINSGVSFSMADDYTPPTTLEILDNGCIELDSGEQIAKTADLFVSIFDGEFINSIEYSPGVRNVASEFSFNYSGTEIKIKTNPTIASSYVNRALVTVLINGVFDQNVMTLDTSYVSVTIPSGAKKVTLIESTLSMISGTLRGTFITDVQVKPYNYSKINEISVSEKFVFIGDSITIGGNSYTPAVDSYARLFAMNDDKEVAVLGYGSGRLYHFASDPTRLTNTISTIIQMFSNVTGRKVLTIALGTNDFGLAATPLSTFQGWYSDFLNAVNAADSDIEIFCISPLLRTGETSLLGDYRVGINTECSNRIYTTYVSGPDMVSVGNLNDGLHPDNTGHIEFNTNYKPIII